MADMKFRRGDIIHDYRFVYSKTTKQCKKWLTVLNKDYSIGDPLVVAPATSQFNPNDFCPNCNLKKHCFHISEDWSFLKAGTLIQFSEMQLFEDYLIKINFKNKDWKREEGWRHTDKETELLFKCLSAYKKDIDMDMQELIF